MTSSWRGTWRTTKYLPFPPLPEEKAAGNSTKARGYQQPALCLCCGGSVVLALSMIYAAFGNVPVIEDVFFGIKGGLLVIVVEFTSLPAHC